jgi:hypothetical protein
MCVLPEEFSLSVSFAILFEIIVFFFVF